MQIPYIVIDVETGKEYDDSLALNPLHCGNWDKEIESSWGGIKFYHPKGVVTLVPRHLIRTSTLPYFPDDAFYISKDNWYLRCSGADNNGARFDVYSPDGLVYSMGSIERVASEREFSDQIKYFSQYLIRISEIRRLQSTLKYIYEPAPDNNSNKYQVYPPRFIGPLASNRNVIRGKKRLVKIKALNSQGNDARTVTLHYRSNTDPECPNLISRIESDYATNSTVSYQYEHNTNSLQTHRVSQCLLKEVIYADNSRWTFKYGVDTQSHQFVATVNASPYLQNGFYQQANFPLHNVTIPDGASVSYLYTTLGVCEYQDVNNDSQHFDYHNATGYLNNVKCLGGHRHPAVTKRTVYDGSDRQSIPTLVHNIGYDQPVPNPDNQVVRFIDNPARRHKLTFGRIDRFKPPIGEARQSDRRLYSGKLLQHDIFALPNKNNPVYSSVHQYKENNNFNDYGKIGSFYPVSSSVDFQIRSSYYKYLYDAMRINRHISTINMNGDTFITQFRQYNRYNHPHRIDELHNNLSRTTAISYDNEHAHVWRVGAKAYKGTGPTLNGDPDPDNKATRRWFYSPDAEVISQSEQGFSTQFEYFPSGDLKSKTDGNGNRTSYSDYRNGSPYTTVSAVGGVLTTKTDPTGLVTETIDAEGITNHYRYNNMGQEVMRWSGTDGKGITKTIPAVLHDPDAAYFRRQVTYQPARYSFTTRFDALGRVIITHEQSEVTGNKQRWQVFQYDQLGRQQFVSDFGNDHLITVGTHYTYDALDRIQKIEHTSQTGSIDYCYGPPCNHSAFSVPGAQVRHGHVVRDESGFLSAYNFQSFGGPGDPKLMEIVQQIDGNDSVRTTIGRNVHGFITSINQNGWERRYTPYKRGDSLTQLTRTEYHPEFSNSDKWIWYDNVGNIQKLNNYSGNTLTYTYTPLNQIATASSSDGSYDAQYQYYQNGMIKSSQAGGAVWDYAYVPGKALLASEALSIDEHTFSVDYTYGDYDDLISMDYPDGLSLHYLKNAFNQTEQITLNSGDQLKPLLQQAHYFHNDDLAAFELSNGQTFQSTQNARSLPEHWKTVKSGVQQNALDFTYHYDARRNVAAIERYFPPYHADLDNLEYDGLSRLIRAEGIWPGNATFDYDKLGNIVRTDIGGSILSYVYNSQNLLSAVNSNDSFSTPSRQFTYDFNGNVTGNGSNTLSYDEMNQMLTSTRTTTDNGLVSVNNLYDANHHRAKTTRTDNRGTLTTYSLYSDGSLLYERDQESGESRHHIYLNGQSIATLGSHNSIDTDGDGIPDYYERLHGLNPHLQSDTNGDADGDGLSNRQEYELGSLAMSSDSDSDGMPDSWEHEFGLAITDTGNAQQDDDNDGVSNINEYHAGSNPSEHQYSYSGQMLLAPILHQQLH